ncbi:MAG: SWIM zinc finger family protein [Isosphaeraceae bacterium]
MAQSQTRTGGSGKRETSSDTGWTKLTWEDLDRWAGSQSVARGRSYQRGGRVKDLKISSNGELLATVMGGERYVTTVALRSERKRSSLESSCTCPVAISCKHAVAVVAEYLKALTDQRDVPIASEDDPRWADLEGDGIEFDDDRDAEYEDNDESWDDDEADATLPRKPRGRESATRPKAAQVSWDNKIEQHLRAKTKSELADLIWSLAQRFPQIYQEFRERIALQEGDVERLLTEARREIQQVTSEPAWRNDWSGDGHIPDYSKIKHRFERLLALGHADEVVSLGREFIQQGIQQVGESQDEGDTAMAFAECLPVVFQAVMQSRLSGPERLLFVIDAELDDGYDVIGEASAPVFDACSQPEDWSAVADTLAHRLKATPAPEKPREGDFHRNYQRDQLTNWIASALEKAGREGELKVLYESEARATGSYERLVEFLLQKRYFEDAEQWAREGIAATSAKLPGIASNLALKQA